VQGRALRRGGYDGGTVTTRRPSWAAVCCGFSLFMLAACGGGSGKAGTGGASSGGTGGGPGTGGGGSGALGAAGISGGAGGAVSGSAGVGGAPSGSAGTGAAGSGQAGGRGGTAAGGGGTAGVSGATGGVAAAGQGGAAGAGTGGTAAPGSCDDFSCPDLGTCSLTHEGNGCLRVCNFKDHHILLRSNADVAQLAALRCNIINSNVNIYDPVDSLAGLETIRTVQGELNVLDSHSLSTLAGLDGLEEVIGSLVLLDSPPGTGNRTLQSAELPSLKTVDGLSVQSDGASESLHAIHFPSLETAGLIAIVSDHDLTDIDLPSLKAVTSYIRLNGNDALTSLGGFASLQSAPDLYIAMNPRLPQCQVDALASRVGARCVSCGQNDPNGTCM
jgi:hypothetical protein